MSEPTPEQTNPVVEVHAAVAQTQRRNGWLTLALGLLVTALVLALWWAINKTDDAERYKSLYEQAASKCAEADTDKAECQDAVDKADKGTPGPKGDKGDTGPGATPEEIREQVDDYFVDNPIEVPGVDVAQLRTEVASYLTAHPPAPGRPPTAREIAEEVARQLRANPPPAGEDGEDGTDGENGLSWTDVRLTPECRLVFTRSDGREQTVGPVCGRDGHDGADGATGPTGVVTTVDACNPPAGEVVTDSGISYDSSTQTITLTCTSVPQVLPKAAGNRALAGQ